MKLTSAAGRCEYYETVKGMRKADAYRRKRVGRGMVIFDEGDTRTLLTLGIQSASDLPAGPELVRRDVR